MLLFSVHFAETSNSNIPCQLLFTKSNTVLNTFGIVTVKNSFIALKAVKNAVLIASKILFTPFLNHSHLL